MLAVTRSVPAPEAVATLRLRGTDSIRDGWVDRGLDHLRRLAHEPR